MNFFYSFTETLMHSLWQSALLTLVYISIITAARNMHPLQKRNVLYNLLAVQFAASIFTFCIYFFEATTSISLFQISNANWLLQYSNFIFYGYTAVILFRAIILCFQWHLFKQQYKEELLKPSADIKIFTKLKAYQLGIKRKVSVWYCEHVQVPITFGFLKPIILIPLSLLNNISMQETETIILHELAHIKNKDYLLNWLLVIMETIYFFNPFIKILVEKLKIEREKNCDVQVVNFDYDEILYAQVLLKMASAGHSIKNFQMGAVFKSSQLLKRILFFSNKESLVFKRYQTNVLTLLLLPFFVFIVMLILPVNKKNYTDKNTETALQIFTPTNRILFSPTKEITKKYSIPVDENAIIKDDEVGHKPIKRALAVTDLSKRVEPIEENDLLKRVSYNEAEPDSTKEILYNVENARGKMTKSFKLYKIKGKWIIEQQWTIMETNAYSVKLEPKVMYMEIDSIQ